jgi:hypothetical protein
MRYGPLDVARQPVCWSAGGSVPARCTGCVGRPVDSCSVGSAIRIPASSVAGRSPEKDHSVVAGCVRARSSVLMLVALRRVLLMF